MRYRHRGIYPNFRRRGDGGAHSRFTPTPTRPATAVASHPWPRALAASHLHSGLSSRTPPRLRASASTSVSPTSPCPRGAMPRAPAALPRRPATGKSEQLSPPYNTRAVTWGCTSAVFIMCPIDVNHLVSNSYVIRP